MTKQVQRRRGTATQHTSFTGAEGETSVNTTNKSVHVHDGATAGGIEAARADLVNVSDASLNAALTGNTVPSLTITTADINGGTVDGTVIGGTTAAAGTFTALTSTGALTTTGSVVVSRAAGFGSVEVGGPSGALIDLKAPASDDYDARIMYNGGSELQITTLAAGEPILLRQGNSTKLATSSTGVAVTGNIAATGSVTAGDMFITGPSPLLRLTDNDADDKHTTIQNNNGSTFIDGRNATANGDIIFRGAGGGVADEYARFDSSGNVSIGTTSNPGYKLSLVGIGTVQLVNRTGTDGTAILFQNDGSNVGAISVSGSATAYNTSSDYRLKKDWLPMSGASERVMALNPVNFAWKIDDSRVDGFLAHELAEVVPEAATGTKDAMMDEEYEVTPAVVDEDGNETSPAVLATRSVPDMQGIDQSKLVPLLTAALQDALTKIADLESRITALED